MQNTKGILKWVAVFIVIVALGVGLGWLGSRRASSPPVFPGPTAEKAALRETAAPPLTHGAGTNLEMFPVPPMAVETPEATSTNLEDQIGDILGDDSEITNKVVALLKLYPKLSSGGKLECAEHLNNLVADEDYAPLGEILTNSASPPAVNKFLLDELLNRPKSLMMPLTLAVACDTNNPVYKDARDTLETFVDENYGDDNAKWKKAVEEWLKENPD
jgi:hypothetical protein